MSREVIPAQRMQLLDAARVVAAIGVVAAHVVDEFFPGDPIGVLGTFAVPFYLFVALYFAVHGLAAKPDRSVGRYVVGRVFKLYVPFLLWNVVYDILHIAKHPHDGVTPPAMILWAAFYTHLYFLPLLLVLSIVTVLIARPVLNLGVGRFAVAILLLAAGFAIALSPQPTQFRDPTRIELETLWNFYRSLPASFAALAFAIAVGARKLRIPAWLGLAGVVLTVGCLGTEWRLHEHPILRTASGFGLVLLAFVPFDTRWIRPIAALGRLSFGVYLSHVLIIRLCVTLIDHAGAPHSMTMAAGIMLAALVGGYALSAILARSRWTRWTIGCESPDGTRACRLTSPAMPSPRQIARPQISVALPSEPR